MATEELPTSRDPRRASREPGAASAAWGVGSRCSASEGARSARRMRSSTCHVRQAWASCVRVGSGGSAGGRPRMPALSQRVCRRVAGNIPGRRLASRAGRMYVGGRLRGSSSRTGGGRLVDRRDSTDVVASSGTSAPSRTPQRASPRCICEAHSSHGCHPLPLSYGFRALHRRCQPSGRSASNCLALRSRTELSGSSRAFRGCAGGLWGPRDGRAVASDAPALGESQPG